MHAPVLLAAVPLMMSALIVIFPNGRFGWFAALAAVTFSLFMAFELVAQTQLVDVISYHLGGWAPPYGIEFRVDALNAAIVLLLGLIRLLALWRTGH